MNGRLDLQLVRARHPIPAIAGRVVKLLRAGSEWKACCPFHADRSPSFTIFDNGRRFHCFGCGAAGDVLDFVQRTHRVGFREAAAILEGGTFPVAAMEASAAAAPSHDRTVEALAIWDRAENASGTPAESYLRSRRLQLPLPSAIRFTRLAYGKSGPQHPVMVTIVTDAQDRPTGIQRTYLNAAGTGKAAVAKPKLSLGRIAGGAIRLGPASSQVTVCEGLEDGLTLAQGGAGPVWVAAGASMLAGMKFPPVVRSVVIGADGDDAGEREALKAGAAYVAGGLQARIIRPLAGFKDFNAELQGAIL